MINVTRLIFFIFKLLNYWLIKSIPFMSYWKINLANTERAWPSSVILRIYFRFSISQKRGQEPRKHLISRASKKYLAIFSRYLLFLSSPSQMFAEVLATPLWIIPKVFIWVTIYTAFLRLHPFLDHLVKTVF